MDLLVPQLPTIVVSVVCMLAQALVAPIVPKSQLGAVSGNEEEQPHLGRHKQHKPQQDEHVHCTKRDNARDNSIACLWKKPVVALQILGMKCHTRQSL